MERLKIETSKKCLILSHSTAFDELKKMLDLEVIEMIKQGRNAHYVLIT